MPCIPYLPYIPNIPYFPNMPYQTDHTHHTQHTIPHPHDTTGGEGDSATPPPHHRGEGGWDPSHGGRGGWQGLVHIWGYGKVTHGSKSGPVKSPGIVNWTRFDRRDLPKADILLISHMKHIMICL